MLIDARVRELWALWSAKPPTQGWADWMKRYGTFLEGIAALPDKELRSPARQEELWRARAVTGIGPGEAVTVKGAYADPEIVDRILALRHTAWPSEPKARSSALQAEYDALLELVVSKGHARARPHAKLGRLFASVLPADFHCIFKYAALKHLREQLLLKKSEDGLMAEHVLARARLRELLGPEEGIAGHVQRSVFCWWLHEHHDEIQAGKTDFSGPTGGNEVELEPLSLWSFSKQMKGISAITRLSACYRDVVRAALEGAEKQEIADVLGADPNYAKHSSNTRNYVVSTVKSAGLLTVRDGLIFPTEAGEDFLENDVPDALVELFLVRVFPFAHLLRLLGKKPLPTGLLYTELQNVYPNWKTTQVPAQTLSWCRNLGLVETSAGVNRLTDYGEAWAKRLPAALPSPVAGEDVEELDTSVHGSGTELPVARKWPTLQTMLAAFASDKEASRFVFDPLQLAALHTAWHCHAHKRFVILSGLSGTGKTAILRCYARLYVEALGRDPAVELEEHLALVPVSPDWRDPSGLLGYANRLREDPTYETGPALRLLVRAARTPGLPFFLLLDEMNLARVEQYFAPLLSAMETGGSLELYSGDEDIGDIPRQIAWPSNLFIGGTVNMDESTYPFSDKVLDRAFTLEFWDADLQSLFAKRTVPQPEVEAVVAELQGLLRPARRHFGYRTAEEILSFVEVAGGSDFRPMLDQAVFSKVLPRIRGEQTEVLGVALREARKLCEKHGLTRCTAKLAAMHEQLLAVGLTKFWG